MQESFEEQGKLYCVAKRSQGGQVVQYLQGAREEGTKFPGWGEEGKLKPLLRASYVCLCLGFFGEPTKSTGLSLQIEDVCICNDIL